MGEELQQRNVLIFQDSPLERIASSAVVPNNVLTDLVHSRFFLGSDFYMGTYGVTGFLVIDSRPEERWESYTDTNLYGVSHSLKHCMHIPQEVRNDPIRLSHYINTDKGFKMIRYFLLPSNVKELFSRDRHLKDSLVRKCCEDVPITEWFDEETANEIFTGYNINGSWISSREDGEKLVNGIIEGISPNLKETGESKFEKYDFRHEHYVSFHSWQVFRQCLVIGEDAVIAAIGNFDRMIPLIDKRGELKRRDLRTEGAYEHRLALPSM